MPRQLIEPHKDEDHFGHLHSPKPEDGQSPARCRPAAGRGAETARNPRSSLRYIKWGSSDRGYKLLMATTTFLCPNMGVRVQAWFADNGNNGEVYEQVTCLACRRVHLVNRRTGKILGFN
jgi:hypothetical protein